MAILIYIVHRVRDGSDYKIWIRAFHQALIISFLLVSCNSDKNAVNYISIQWKETQATSLVIPREFVQDIPDDSISELLFIHLIKEGDRPAVLGDFQLSENRIVFTPLIPMTRGLKYEVLLRNNSLGVVQIPVAETDVKPEVLAVFPSQDTLPENLLKIYIKFSAPMQEDQAMQHLSLIRNETDTISSAFLSLQQELWNKERTILTVWLHPGRIKRELQPNKNLGAPLQSGGFYRIIISPEWKDINGASLRQLHSKKFTVASRDSLSPDTQKWTLDLPVGGSKNALELKFDEPLIYTLIQESIEIYDQEQKQVDGTLEVLPEETGVAFIPTFNWKKGSYYIRIQSRLEDLAGNNLNRAFDRDISIEKPISGSDSFEIRFEVK